MVARDPYLWYCHLATYVELEPCIDLQCRGSQIEASTALLCYHIDRPRLCWSNHHVQCMIP
jgi:hypothetical protein